MVASTILGHEAIYRRRGGPRRRPRSRGGPHPRGGPRPRLLAVPAMWVAPQVTLWSLGVFWRIKIPRKFSAHSENISCDRFSEIQKQQKQETGTGHLVNRLVRQNA